MLSLALGHCHDAVWHSSGEGGGKMSPGANQGPAELKPRSSAGKRDGNSPDANRSVTATQRKCKRRMREQKQNRHLDTAEFSDCIMNTQCRYIPLLTGGYLHR